MRRPKLFPLVEVRWRDAYHHSGWETLKNFTPNALKVRQRTAGYLVHEDDEVITLAHSVDDQEPDRKGADFMVIPKVCIEHRRRLE